MFTVHLIQCPTSLRSLTGLSFRTWPRRTTPRCRSMEVVARSQDAAPSLPRSRCTTRRCLPHFCAHKIGNGILDRQPLRVGARQPTSFAPWLKNNLTKSSRRRNVLRKNNICTKKSRRSSTNKFRLRRRRRLLPPLFVLNMNRFKKNFSKF